MCANLLKYLLKPAVGGKRTIKVPVGSQAGWGTPGLGSTPQQLLQGQPAPPTPRLAPHQFVVNLCVAPCEGPGVGGVGVLVLSIHPPLPAAATRNVFPTFNLSVFPRLCSGPVASLAQHASA